LGGFGKLQNVGFWPENAGKSQVFWAKFLKKFARVCRIAFFDADFADFFDF